MVLVDTSIWIEFFKKNDPVFSHLRELVESGDVIVHEIIFGELLQGCKNKSELNFILEYWDIINSSYNQNDLIEAGKLSFKNKYINKGIGLIDSVLINIAKKYNYRIWTLDKKILNVLSKNEIYVP